MSASSLNAQGVRLYQQSRYQEALQQFGQALVYDPNDADAYYNIAAVYHRMGEVYRRPEEFPKAEQYYRLCLGKSPDHTAGHRGLAVLLVRQGRSAEAFQLMQDWMLRRPDLADPRIELARLYEESGDTATAKRYLTEALAIDPRNVRAMNALGHLREISGERELALVSYQQSLQFNPRQPELAARAATLESQVRLAQAAPKRGGFSAPAADRSLLR
ncbi:tetratricopeptide repeat protein [Thermopirellula anaerolimosa]